MSTLGSWIDKDELAAVVAQLVPAAGPVPHEAEPAQALALAPPLVADVSEIPQEQEVLAAVPELEPALDAPAVEPTMEAEVVEVPAEIATVTPEVISEPEIEPAPGAPAVEPTVEAEVVEVPAEIATVTPEVISEPEIEPAPGAPAVEPTVEAEVVEVPAEIATVTPEVISEPEIEPAPGAPAVEPTVEAEVIEVPAEIATVTPEVISEPEIEPEAESILESDSDQPAPEIKLAEETVIEPEPSGAPSVETDEELISLNFDQPEAYEAAAFPFQMPATSPDWPVSPLRRTAAVQASVALERARDRAEQGGLLKQFGPETVAVEPESSASDSPVILIEPIPDVPPPPVAAFEPVEVATPELTPAVAEPDPALADPVSDESPGGPPLRERLLGFAHRTAEATGSSEVAITDFQSYPLLLGSEAVASPDSALRLAHWFGSLARELKASRDGVSQIVLSDGSWLGIVAADSAAGGVCASFRTSEPIPAERAKELTDDLRATLQPA